MDISVKNAGAALAGHDRDNDADDPKEYSRFVHDALEKQRAIANFVIKVRNLNVKTKVLKIFDAGVGSGDVLISLVKEAMRNFKELPFHLVCKEFEAQNAMAALPKMAEILDEHPQTAITLTNMFFNRASSLQPTEKDKPKLVRKTIYLTGNTKEEFEEQLRSLQGFFDKYWGQVLNSKNRRVPERPVILTVVRKDQKAVMQDILPKENVVEKDYHLILASQASARSTPAETVARNLMVHLMRALAPEGMLIGMDVYGRDHAEKLINKVLPRFKFLRRSPRQVFEAAMEELTVDQRCEYGFEQDRKQLIYPLRGKREELSGPIAEAFLNMALYVGQLPRKEKRIVRERGLKAAREVIAEETLKLQSDSSKSKPNRPKVHKGRSKARPAIFGKNVVYMITRNALNAA